MSASGVACTTSRTYHPSTGLHFAHETSETMNPIAPSLTDWISWQPDLRTTLIFVRRDDALLLIEKKTGLGQGKINGPGGKIEVGETPAAGALRELWEEVGLTAFEPQLAARLFFSDVEDLNILVYVFVTDQFDGDPHETAEAKPIWVDVQDIPYEKMWEDDQYWLPQVLSGESVDAYFQFSGERLVSFRVDPLGQGAPPKL